MFLTASLALNDYVNRLTVSVLLLFCGCALLTLVLLKIFRPRHETSIANLIYGGCLLACGLGCYLYTTRFPGLPVPLLRHIDHSAIFLLIAGTCTPFAAHKIRGPLGIPLLVWVWSMAVAGIVMRLTVTSDFDQFFVVLYVGMGWVFFAAVRDIARHVSARALVFLGIGAVVYSVGAVIFSIGVGRWTDAIWHVFVLSAAALHFVAVLSLSKGRQASPRPMNAKAFASGN